MLEKHSVTAPYLEAIRRDAERRYGPRRVHEVDVEDVNVNVDSSVPSIVPGNEQFDAVSPMLVQADETVYPLAGSASGGSSTVYMPIDEQVESTNLEADKKLVNNFKPVDHYVKNWLGQKTHLSNVENLHAKDLWLQYVNILDTIEEMLKMIREYKDCSDWSSLSMHCRTMCKLGLRSGVFKILLYSLFMFSDDLNKKCSNVMSIQKDVDFPIDKIEEYSKERGKIVKLYNHELAHLICVYDYVLFMKFCMEQKKNDHEMSEIQKFNLQYKFILHLLEDCLLKERIYFKKIAFVRFVLFTFLSSVGTLYLAGQFIFSRFASYD